MKKRINLLRLDNQTGPPPIVRRIEQYSIWVGLFLFFIFLGINAFFLFLRLKLNDYNQQKANLIAKINENQDIEAQILYFSRKEDQVTTFLKDDAQFLPYYNLLKDLLVFSSNSPVLQSMTLDKNKVTDFVVGFPAFDQAYQFLHFIESENFLDNFSELTLNNLTIAERSSITNNTPVANQGYQLHFHGKFKNLNGTHI